MVVLAGRFAQMHHLKVGADAGPLTLARVHPPPFLLDLYKQRHVAEKHREEEACGYNVRASCHDKKKGQK